MAESLGRDWRGAMQKKRLCGAIASRLDRWARSSKIFCFEGTARTLKSSTLLRFAFTLGQFIEFQIDRRFLAGIVVAK
jgi:hypothetical protein